MTNSIDNDNNFHGIDLDELGDLDNLPKGMNILEKVEVEKTNRVHIDLLVKEQIEKILLTKNFEILYYNVDSDFLEGGKMEFTLRLRVKE